MLLVKAGRMQSVALVTELTKAKRQRQSILKILQVSLMCDSFTTSPLCGLNY